MPTVPRTTGPSVELRAAPNVQQSVAGVTPDAFGARNVQNLQDIGQMVSRYKEQDDADRIFRAETALKTDYLAFERSELERNGVDAKGAGERAQKWWGEAQRKYSEGLNNGRQEKIFQRSSTAIQMAGNETLMRHETQQRNKSLGESTIAQMQTASDMAIADPSPERLALSKQQIMASNQVLGQLRGDTPEVIKQREQSALTGMHKGVIMRMVDDDPDAAKAYYYGNRKEIAGPEQAVIEKALKNGGLLLKGQQVADEVLNKFTSLGEAEAYIQKNYSGEEERAIKAEVRDRFHVADMTVKKAQTDAYGQGQLLVAQRKPIPQSLALTMGDGHYAHLIEHREAKARADEANARARAGDGNAAIKTDFKTYDYINEMSWRDPASFAVLDLGRFQDRLSTADLKKFSEDKQKIGTAEGVKGLQSRQEQITTAVNQMKLTGDSNAEKRGLFSRNVNDAIETEQKTQGRPLKYAEIQKVIDQQVMTVAVPGFLWGTNEKRNFEVTSEERTKNPVVVVPDFDKKQITEALKAKGQKPTDENIRALYKQVKGIK